MLPIRMHLFVMTDESQEYCQNICLLAKLFLDHKVWKFVK